MKFEDKYNLIMEGLNDLFKAVKSNDDLLDNDYEDIDEIEEMVVSFITYDEYQELYNKFKNRLQEELDKVKPKNPILKDVELSIEGCEIPDDEGLTVMSVERNNTKTILVNCVPFLKKYNKSNKSDEAFENAISIYYYDMKGNHIIQHECAHVIDYNSGHRRDIGSHDQTFEKIRQELEAIEPHLDQL